MGHSVFCRWARFSEAIDSVWGSTGEEKTPVIGILMGITLCSMLIFRQLLNRAFETPI